MVFTFVLLPQQGQLGRLQPMEGTRPAVWALASIGAALGSVPCRRGQVQERLSAKVVGREHVVVKHREPDDSRVDVLAV